MKPGPLTASVDALIREQRAEPIFHLHVFSRTGLLNLLAALFVACVSAGAGAGLCHLITLIHG